MSGAARDRVVRRLKVVMRPVREIVVRGGVVVWPICRRGVAVCLPPLRRAGAWIGRACGATWRMSRHWVRERVCGRARLRPRERQLLDELLAGRPADLLFPTRTRVDVGYWLGKRRVWGCLCGGELLLMAQGRHPFHEAIASGELGESRYNHVTGEMVLAPAPGLECVRLRLPPLEGYEVLSRFSTKEVADA